MQLIDFHRHILVNNKEILQVKNVYLQEITSFKPKGLFSCGLHPWHLDMLTLKECQNLLTCAINLPGLLAVGECGFDKNVDFPPEIQLEFLRMHISVAKLYHKPLIIHCVKRHGELLHLLKEEKFKEPVIIHGFDSKLSVATQLIEHGIKFSFGAAILKPEHPAAEVLANISSDDYFLETDDDDFSIQEIYQKAAEIRKTDIWTIIKEIALNFTNIQSK